MSAVLSNKPAYDAWARKGAAETRASIVEWLRVMAAAYKLPNGPEPMTSAAFGYAADAIERGEDLKVKP